MSVAVSEVVRRNVGSDMSSKRYNVMLLMYADIISQGPECAEYSTVHSVANTIEMSLLGNEYMACCSSKLDSTQECSKSTVFTCTFVRI